MFVEIFFSKIVSGKKLGKSKKSYHGAEVAYESNQCCLNHEYISSPFYMEPLLNCSEWYMVQEMALFMKYTLHSEVYEGFYFFLYLTY